jgi:biotin carboxylase
MKRVLLLLPAAGYRNDDFLAAAERLGVEIVAAADYCHRLAPSWGMPPLMALHFDQPEDAAAAVLRTLDDKPDAVLAVDESGIELAALLSQRFGLAGNPVHAVRRLRDKLAFRGLLREHGFACPTYRHLPAGDDPRAWAAELTFPVVVKARRLSASRGVIRADDPAALSGAVERVRAIQARADRDHRRLGVVVEEFVPGREYALEGILEQGRLTTLALFDKPDPLDGPYFEETLYVTPSRLPQAVQDRIEREVARACAAADLATGPVHAEVRVNDRGIWLLEVAPRSIGGLCGRVLTQALGTSLEALILGQAIGHPVRIERAGGAAGVMMIPVPRRGIYDGVEGLADARSVRCITGITITATPGQSIAPPPDGACYLGFIFARATSAADAEAALRSAHGRLRFALRPQIAARESA